MNITREQREGGLSILKVVVGEADYGQAVEKQLKEYKRKANVPGFRPGMVPMGIVKKMYGKHIVAEQSYHLASNSVFEYLKNENIDYVGDIIPSEEQGAFDFENGTEFEFVFEFGEAPKINIEFTAKDKVVYNKIKVEEAVKDDFGTYRYAADQSIIVYPIYKSAPWVFSRYDDDKGAVVSTVIPEYIEAFKALVEPITFQEWIKGDDGYAISFKRKFVLDANYRVFDTDGNEGVAHTSYQIEIN